MTYEYLITQNYIDFLRENIILVPLFLTEVPTIVEFLQLEIAVNWWIAPAILMVRNIDFYDE